MPYLLRPGSKEEEVAGLKCTRVGGREHKWDWGGGTERDISVRGLEEEHRTWPGGGIGAGEIWLGQDAEAKVLVTNQQ